MGDGNESDRLRVHGHANAVGSVRMSGPTPRFLIAFVSALLLASTFAAAPTVAVASDPGFVDVDFGTGGSTSIPGGDAQSVVPDMHGNVYVTTTDMAAYPPTVSITKLDSAGRVVASFGAGGVLMVERPGLGDADDFRMTVDRRGRLVTASMEESGGELHLVVRKFRASGVPDETFSEDGAAAPIVLPSAITDVASLGGLMTDDSDQVYVNAVSSTVDVNAGTAAHTGMLFGIDELGTVESVSLPTVDEPLEHGFPVDSIAPRFDGGVLHVSARNPHVEVRLFGSHLEPIDSWGEDGVAVLRQPHASGLTIGTGQVMVRSARDGTYVSGAFLERTTNPGEPTSQGTFVGRFDRDGRPDPEWGDGAVVGVLPGGADAAELVDIEPAPGGGLVVVDDESIRQLDVRGTVMENFGSGGSAPVTGMTPEGTAAVTDSRLIVVGDTAFGPTARAYGLDVPEAPPAPGPPTVLVQGGGNVVVSWDEPVPARGTIYYVVTGWADGLPEYWDQSPDRIVYVGGLDPDKTYTFTVAAVNEVGRGPDSLPSRPIVAGPHDEGPGSVYVPLKSCRLMDTRVSGRRVGRTLRAVGVVDRVEVENQGGLRGGCGVPREATAVVAAVSAVDPSGKGYLRVGAGAEEPPRTTFVTFDGASVTNVGPLALGRGETSLGVQAFGSSTDVVIDVLGYFAERRWLVPTEGSVYVPISPCRVFDTRINGAAVRSGVERTVSVSGDLAAQGGNPAGCSIPAGATAVEAALSSVEPSAGGYARLGPAGRRPAATVLNVTAGRPVATTSTVPLGGTPGGGVGLALLARGVKSDWVVDVTGYYLPRTDPASASGSVYEPATPCRLADTRRAGGAMTTGSLLRVTVAGDGPAFPEQGGTPDGCGVPAWATAASLTFTAADAAGDGYTRVAPAGVETSGATVVQFRRGSSSTGGGSFALGDGAVDVRTYGGPTNQVVELQGWFVPLEPIVEDG